MAQSRPIIEGSGSSKAEGYAELLRRRLTEYDEHSRIVMNGDEIAVYVDETVSDPWRGIEFVYAEWTGKGVTTLDNPLVEARSHEQHVATFSVAA